VSKGIRFVGLDVHKETITVAVAEPDGSVVVIGKIPNRPEAVKGLIKRLGPVKKLRVCYEAGPCGYVLYWQLTGLNVDCEVVAPSRIPREPGDRVKTDRRDARKLATLYRAGLLTAVWVPDAAHEALRDLVRAREAAKKDELRARHRLGKFLLRSGRRAPDGVKAWGKAHRGWLDGVSFERPEQEVVFLDYRHEVDHAVERVLRLERALDEAVERVPASQRAVIEGLQALRGVSKVTAVTIYSEVGELSRFERPRLLMGYSGMVSSEDSSGKRIHRGSITHAGNAHFRRVVVQSAWAYCRPPKLSPALKKRQARVSAEIKEISWKAQHRLYGRYRHLVSKGKLPQKAITAVARELVGFIWDIGVRVENQIRLDKQGRPDA
jgi:transposase